MSKNKKDNIPFLDYVRELGDKNTNYDIDGGSFGYINMRKMDRSDFKKLVYKNIYSRLYNILIKMYKWKTPDFIDPRIIEIGYIENGAVCGCDIPKYGKYILPATPTNSYNVYGNPLSVRVRGLNGFNKVVDIDYGNTDGTELNTRAKDDKAFIKVDTPVGTGVYSRDNDIAYPYINYIREYAYKISDKMVAMHISTQRLKNPFMFVVDEKDMIDTFKQMVDKIESNDDVIFRISNKGKIQGREEPLQAIANTMKPETLMAQKDAILFDLNQFLETVGINTNPSPDKSQVVLTPEIESNNDLIELEEDIRFENRQKFCKDLKRIGIDVSVSSTMEEAKKEAEKLKKDMMGGVVNDNDGKKDKSSND